MEYKQGRRGVEPTEQNQKLSHFVLFCPIHTAKILGVLEPREFFRCRILMHSVAFGEWGWRRERPGVEEAGKTFSAPE